MNFSSLHRRQIKDRMKSGTWDLLVIGGGITGAGIALDAASRGLQVALLEKEDFASGTSSRSTKLIHGGLRYLKQLEFALVKEVGSERAIVHRLAPHLVVPEKMLLPLYEKRGLGYWLTSVGLKIYDWLAGVKPEDQRRMLTAPQTTRQEPLLKKEDIKGGALYAEYRTDDARLTIEIAKQAFNHGALVLNYARVSAFTYADGQLSGAEVTDVLTGDAWTMSANTVVNAAGPWVDDVRGMDGEVEGKRLHLTKGVHVVVPYHRLPVRQAIYFDVPDGRMIFAIPRGRITYVGTTDTDYKGDKDKVFATREDVLYLLHGINETFEGVHLTMADVESAWAGLRPLIHEDGKSASELSRKDEIFVSDTGLISIAGGKLTGYRRMAERVVDLVIEKHFAERELPGCTTAQMPLVQPSFPNVKEANADVGRLAHEMSALGLKGEDAQYLTHLYGRQTSVIIEHMRNLSGHEPDTMLLLSELWYCVQYEMVTGAADFFVRRTGMLYFNLPRLLQTKERVLQQLGAWLGWNESEKRKQHDDLEAWISETLTFKNG